MCMTALGESRLYQWLVSDADALLLAQLLKMTPEDIIVRRTLASEPAPLCKCGRQVGLYDIARHALFESVHARLFLSDFFRGEGMDDHLDPAHHKLPADVEHRVFCANCGRDQGISMHWFGTGKEWAHLI